MKEEYEYYDFKL